MKRLFEAVLFACIAHAFMLRHNLLVDEEYVHDGRRTATGHAPDFEHCVAVLKAEQEFHVRHGQLPRANCVACPLTTTSVIHSPLITAPSHTVPVAR